MKLDKDMYKPAHEKPTPGSPASRLASRSFVAEESEHMEMTDKGRWKGINPYIDFRLFVSLDPLEPLNGPQSKRLDKSIFALGIFAGVWGAFSLLTFGFMKSLLQINAIILGLLYLIIGIALFYVIVTKFIYKSEDSRRSSAMNRGNKSMNLGSVWGINPGGINEGVALGGKHTSVYYKGKEAIVLKVLKKSVLVSNDMADWTHYEGLQLVEDLLSRYGYTWTKINAKYDTENDYIWDELNDSLLQSSMIYGKEYTDLMNEIFVYQRKLTKAISTVPVIYYIIQPEFLTPKRDFQAVMVELSSIITQMCRCSLHPVSNKEFLRLLRDYYGVSYLDIETISEFIASNYAMNLEVNVLGYLDNDGQVVKLRDYYEPRLPNRFKTVENITSEKDIEREKKIEITEQENIYGDKIVRQRGA